MRFTVSQATGDLCMNFLHYSWIHIKYKYLKNKRNKNHKNARVEEIHENNIIKSKRR